MAKNNTGKENSGNYNSGHRNSGDRNSGYYNSGYRNSGYYNSGYYNSGNYNSGNYNSGHRNSGDRNSGYYNSGNYNSGHRNSGNYNSGNYNSGNYNSGFFNTNEPTVRMFNRDTGLKRSEISLPYINLKLNEWISESNMSDQQKANDPDFHVKQGTLITRSYKEAWLLYWSEASKEDKQRFLDLPNFNAEIFEEITGINIEESKTVTISVEGRNIEISRDSAKALGLVK